MEKRGTGWIPDYPDVNDYTLANEAIQNLSNKIQSHGDTASIENLAQKVYEALGLLGLLVEQQNKNESNSQKLQNENKPNSQTLNKIRDDLYQNIFGDFRFETVELHSVLKVGMADSGVLLIKNYLERIILTWSRWSYFHEDLRNYEPVLTNTTFDTQTDKAVKRVLETQKWLKDNDGSVDGLVGKDEMDVLALLANGPHFIRDIEEFRYFIERNAEKYKDWLTKYMPDENNLLSNQVCQGILTVYLFPIIKNLHKFKDILIQYLPKEKNPEVQEPPEEKKQTEPNITNLANIISLVKLVLVGNDISHIQKILVEIDPAITEIKDAKNAIKKDQEDIIKIVKQFKSNLETEFSKFSRFSAFDLRDLTEIINEDGFKKKILDPLEIFLQFYEIFKDNYLRFSPDIKSKSNILEDLDEGLNEEFWSMIDNFERYMMLLYLAYPLEIVPELFQKTEIAVSSRIPKPIVELSDNKFRSLLSLESSKSNSTICQEFLQFIKPIVSNLDQLHDPLQKPYLRLIEILAEILMPLGQYRNLSEAVERGIKKIEHLFNDPKDDEKETKNLIRDTIDEYNLGIARDHSLIKELHSHFENQIITLKEEQHQTNGSVSGQTKKQGKKLLFEMRFKPEKNSSNQTSPKPTQNSSQQMKNSLLFPINRTLDERIAEALKNQKDDNKDNQSVFLCLPEFVDLSYWCSPVEDQGALNSCTAHAAIALIEYAQKKSSDTYIDGSPRFLYKVTRSLMQREGDSGASVRDTMKAMVAFGVCPEQYWTYEEDKFDEEPTPFCYSFAENYKTLKYFRLDYASISRYTLLAQVKVLLASEIPCIFGFTLYNSVYDEFNVQKGHIPLPHKRDKVIGGHTVVAVGYHDRKKIENGDGTEAEGALLIRNSWGTRWGQGGYGWLPYDYITQGLTADWWSLLKAEWLATGGFGAGASAWDRNKGDGNEPPKQPQTKP
ncbi:hypothetical protein SAMD00079811_61710 [Scytonema sp. HK-05]|uniref:C1 family peptidase n=1 Tax=Scytonema sp. HK-05 TaxID=1137095 RepID=UPI000935ED1F|nr:C1 family peptidase [Scytonema sp. HK-05]OKH58670.1 hypothetical protein NIES2130_13450 [Scytonema sp. HK-05]BAY48546.1 hypothetical protein SAMD00079811_61710 [Scytonema sp. HK-05]